MKFTKRLLEQAAIVAALAFGAVWVADDTGYTVAAAVAGLAAAGRAVYGLLVKQVGADSESPSVK